MLVLAAEDDLVPSKLVREMLQKMGHPCEVGCWKAQALIAGLFYLTACTWNLSVQPRLSAMGTQSKAASACGLMWRICVMCLACHMMAVSSGVRSCRSCTTQRLGTAVSY